jgi:hypothetical protein
MVKTNRGIGDVTTKLAEIARQLYLEENVDNTATIQAALDKKGHIKIISRDGQPKVITTGKLLIDSDTTFELGAGVTLKKKDATNASILVNKGHTTIPATRNKNICIKGGKWDLNKDGNDNAQCGSFPTNSQSWGLCGILMNGVDGLKITDVEEVGNEYKYCYLIANCTNIYCSNINFNNHSDGLHFQPPINNLLVENITGLTEDDTISFTMGDYTPYALGVDGDIENVLVRNLNMSDGTAEHVKLVGDGINHTSKFRNMRFENIRGEAIVKSVCILQKDQNVANDYLNATYLENVSFSNIQPKTSGQQEVFQICATSGDITVENATWEQSGGARYIQIANGDNGTLNKLTVKNIKSVTPIANAMSSFIRCDATMIVEQLNIIDCILDFSLATSGYGIYPTNNSIKRVNIDNSYFDLGVAGNLLYYDGVNAERTSIKIINSEIINERVFGKIAVPVDIYILNSIINNSAHFAYFDDNGDLNIMSANSKYAIALYANGLSAVRILELNGTDFGFNGLLSTLTPQEGDIVRSVNASEVSGKGIYYYNGTAWEKITA